MIKFRHFYREAAVNFLMGFDIIRKARSSFPRTQSTSTIIEVEKVLKQWSALSDIIDPNEIAGKQFMELGPGDAAPLGFLLVSNGAAGYFTIDRFRGDIFGERSLKLYSEIAAKAFVRGLDAELVSGFMLRANIVLESIEKSGDITGIPPLDYLFSWNVIEHLYNPKVAFRNMRNLVVP